MSSVEQSVQSHYGRGDLLQRVEAALERAGVDKDRPTHQDLFAFDQLHGRGIMATREHAERAGLHAGLHVLDLGCGIGGASRYLASLGCRVTAIDLTPEFIDVAAALTQRCGLADRIEFHQANALDLPFAADSFDHVWSHNVTMNIEDKARFAAEIARVLKPGGRFSCAEVERGPGGEPTFPLPWASDPSWSFLATPDVMRGTLVAAGLHVLEQTDLTEAAIAFVRGAAQRGGPTTIGNSIVMGDDFAVRVRNSGQAMREGKLVEQFILAEKI